MSVSTEEEVRKHYDHAARNILSTVIPLMAHYYSKKRNQKAKNMYSFLFFRVQELYDFLGEYKHTGTWGEDTEDSIILSFQNVLAMTVVDGILPQSTAQQILQNAVLGEHVSMDSAIILNKGFYREDGVSPLLPSLLSRIDIQQWSESGHWEELLVVIRAIDVLNNAWYDCTVTSTDKRTRKIHCYINNLLCSGKITAAEVLNFLPWSFGSRGCTEDLLHSENIIKWYSEPDVVNIVKTLSNATSRGTFGKVDIPELVVMFRGQPNLPHALVGSAVIEVGTDSELRNYVESDHYMKVRRVITPEHYARFHSFYWNEKA